MRPEILFPIFAETSRLAGVGPQIARLLAAVAGPHVGDLLRLLPTGVIDRRHSPTVAEAPDGAVCTIDVTVMAHRPADAPNRPDRVLCSDGSAVLELAFFGRRGGYLSRHLPVGAKRTVSGRVEHYGGRIQMTHPDHIAAPDGSAALRRVEPVYPLTRGLTSKRLGQAVAAALAAAPDLPEWLDDPLMAREGWPSWRDSLIRVHAPLEPDDIAASAPARRRLAYDECLANQLALALMRRNQRLAGGRARRADGRLAARVADGLPFTLTDGQRRALAEIRADMRSDERMLRLLHGDVGSGKTVVAFLAMLDAVETGAQAALMAPTTLLARQHGETIAALAGDSGVRIAVLTGTSRGKARTALLADLTAGRIDIVVGTQALFQAEVGFCDLGLAVIDEQHRFGVHQRIALGDKGAAADMLVMTATPIPRSLMMTMYGDLDVSQLPDKPPGRQAVTTRALPASRLDDVIEAVARARDAGARIYWICPAVSESDASDVAAAEARHRALSDRFGGQVGLAHGRMPEAGREAAVAGFRDGAINILVATTVIEVGLDVPDATVMIIERAERFGLAQLHQLRGRIGRGGAAATCLLLYQTPLGDPSRARLAVLRETSDGFRIAEEDLKLRGSGEILGARQSGAARFRVADPAQHADLLAIARNDAAAILNRDPELVSERGRALRLLLHLFEQDTAARFLKSG